MIDVLVVLLFLLLMVVCAIAALRVKDLLAAVTIFGAFSFFSAAFFVVQDALDVAFTEAAVGAVITTVFFVCAIQRTTRRVQWRGRMQRAWYNELLAMLVLVPALVVLLQAAADLPPVGDGTSAPFTHVAPYYIEHGHEETGASNFVTAVLADYRGYDTFGELMVIFTAGVACLLILGGKDDGPPAKDEGQA
jgi:multicomponent Na+:H+ antiporter subunit B